MRARSTSVLGVAVERGGHIRAGTRRSLWLLALFALVAAMTGGWPAADARASNEAVAWGYDYFGQLGDNLLSGLGPEECAGGTTACAIFAAPVVGTAGSATLAGVAEVAAGGEHSLALLQNGTVDAWGSNGNGQLGLGGNGTADSAPIQIPGLTGVAAVAAGGSHSLALLNGGTVDAWGYNGVGQLGIGTNVDSGSPTPVPGLSGVTQLAGGRYFTLALLSGGTVDSWGEDAFGQLGNGSTANTNSPAAMPGLSGIVKVAAGADHALALKADGSVLAWGANGSGQLGDGLTSGPENCASMGYGLIPCAKLPVPVSELTNVIAIAAGGDHSLALRRDGTVMAWGENRFGQLGVGTTLNSASPVEVQGLSGVSAIAAGENFSLALKSDGTLVAWGANNLGQLGDGSTTESHVPRAVSGVSGITGIAAGAAHGLATGASAQQTLPGAPTAVKARPDNGAAELFWSAPAVQGGSPITSYLITAIPYANNDKYAVHPTITETVPGTGSGPQHGQITGLLGDCHQEYTFKVRAVNASGAGPQSSLADALVPSHPSPPNTSASNHFRTSGIVAGFDNAPPVVVVTIDGFGAQYDVGSNGKPITETVDPLVGKGQPTNKTTGEGPSVSYCVSEEQDHFPSDANTSAPAAIWHADDHFARPGIEPLTPGTFLQSEHYLLDQFVAGGGIALPFSYDSAPKLSLKKTVPYFRYTGYTEDKSQKSPVSDDVAKLSQEIQSIHNTWPGTEIILLGHSGGGLLAEQYWETHNYSAEGVKLVISIESPINGTEAATSCYAQGPNFEPAGCLIAQHFSHFSEAILSEFGERFENQKSVDEKILKRDRDESYFAFSTEGDLAYGFNTNGLFDSVVPDSIFPCEVTGAPTEINSCHPASPPSFVDGGVFRMSDPCEWTPADEKAYGSNVSHSFAIVCKEDVEYAAQLAASH